MGRTWRRMIMIRAKEKCRGEKDEKEERKVLMGVPDCFTVIITIKVG